MTQNPLKVGFVRTIIVRFHVKKKKGIDTIADSPNFTILGSFRRVDVRSSPKVVIRTSDIPNFNKKGNPPLDLPASDSDLLPFTSNFGGFW